MCKKPPRTEKRELRIPMIIFKIIKALTGRRARHHGRSRGAAAAPSCRTPRAPSCCCSTRGLRTTYITCQMCIERVHRQTAQAPCMCTASRANRFSGDGPKHIAAEDAVSHLQSVRSSCTSQHQKTSVSDRAACGRQRRGCTQLVVMHGAHCRLHCMLMKQRRQQWHAVSSSPARHAVSSSPAHHDEQAAMQLPGRLCRKGPPS